MSHPGQKYIDLGLKAIDDLEYFSRFRDLGPNDQQRLESVKETIRAMGEKIVEMEVNRTGRSFWGIFKGK